MLKKGLVAILSCFFLALAIYPRSVCACLSTGDSLLLALGMRSELSPGVEEISESFVRKYPVGTKFTDLNPLFDPDCLLENKKVFKCKYEHVKEGYIYSWDLSFSIYLDDEQKVVGSEFHKINDILGIEFSSRKSSGNLSS